MTPTYRVRAIIAGDTCTLSNYSNEANTMTTTVKGIVASIPEEFELTQNYPNPFNPVTMIAFALPQPGHVTLKVFDLLGKEIATLVDEKLAPGRYEARWDARGVQSGMYFYQLRAGEFVATKKLVLIQ